MCKGFITYWIMKRFFLTEKDPSNFSWGTTSKIVLGFQVWIRLDIQSQPMNYRLQIANDYWDFLVPEESKKSEIRNNLKFEICL